VHDRADVRAAGVDLEVDAALRGRLAAALEHAAGGIEHDHVLRAHRVVRQRARGDEDALTGADARVAEARNH
jgi:hypothetical protein